MSVITVGLLLILSSHSERPYSVQGLFLANDILSSFASTRISELNSPYIEQLCKEGVIKRTDNSILEQAGEFYTFDMRDTAGYLIGNASEGMVPQQYGFMVIINSTAIYNRSITYSSERLLVVSKGIISGVVNSSVMWGPLTAEVRVWQ
ncbi:TPA: hypothetical protein HA317_00415 [Candidatus Woesearchaeota archaeon]|nr:hypothetical protein [Candidatus Woesearchaeota archaeon]